MFCSKCGSENQEKSNCCINCNAALNEIDKDKEKSFKTKSIIFAIISLLFIPPLFGTLGIISGSKLKKFNEKEGNTLIIINVICMILGMALGVAVQLFLF